MKVFFLIFLCVVFASGARKWHQLEGYNFKQYIREFGKHYDGSEFHKREQIFLNRLRTILEHNADPSKTWKRGINHMSDYTEDELSRLRGYHKEANYRAYAKTSRRSIEIKPTFTAQDLPQSIDYRKMGVVSSVKDQGHCGSCWTFATAETIESYFALLTGNLAVLSEQHILDCTRNPLQCGGKGGCHGGTAEIALENLIKMGGGIASEWTYPYISYQGLDFNCTFDPIKTPAEAFVTGYESLGINADDEVLMQHLATKGPLAVSVDANNWHDYEEGIFNGCNQTTPDLDHLVQLVGYGVENDQPYWILRNSWRPTWGEHGYIRIFRTNKTTKQCGIDVAPSDGNGCEGDPPTVEVCGTCGILYDAVYPIVSKTHQA